MSSFCHPIMRPVYGAMIPLLMVTFHGISAQGIGSSFDWDFCKGNCSWGAGDCDKDKECSGELVCGRDNCKHFHSNADKKADCCTRPGTGASIDWIFCSGSCTEGQGDCDVDTDCAGELVCGQDNCKDFHSNALEETDCCVKSGSLMAIGGSNGKDISSAEVLNTSCDFPLPEIRYGHISVITTDGKILVCGGRTPSGYTASCLQFNVESKSWEHHSSLNFKYRYYSSAIALKNGVYVLGGTATVAKSSEFLATGSSKWTQGPTIPGRGASLSCAAKVSDTEFVILGGKYDNEQALVYSTTNNEWTEWARLGVYGGWGHSCLGLGDKVLMAGGYSGTRVARKTIIFDIRTGNAIIKYGAYLKYPRAIAAMQLNGLKAVILGGYDGSGYRSDGEIWNIDTETWEESDIHLNIGRDQFSFVATNKLITCE